MIVVTGATGFVGTYLVDQLVQENVDVVAVGKSRNGEAYYKSRGIPFVQLDITKESDFEKLPREGVDAVVHLAGLLSIDIWAPQDYFMVNTLGTRNVLEYCRKSGVPKVVYSMTHSDVNRTDQVVIKESTPRNYGGGRGFAREYIISKIAAMEFVQCYTNEYGINGVSLRFPGIRGYGGRFISFWKGEPQISAFYMFIQKALKGEPIEVWGEHKIVRDLVYIKDVVRGISSALKSENAVGLYNIGTGKGLTIEDEARAIIKVFSPPDNPSPILYRPDIPELEKRSYIFDITKARNELGYSPKYSYEDALKDYRKEMESGRFRHLLLKQEEVLMRKYGKTIDQLISEYNR